MKRSTHILISCLALLLIWGGLTISAKSDHRTDPDLGISTSKLSLVGNAIWALPLSLVGWATCEAVLLFVAWRLNRPNERTGN